MTGRPVRTPWALLPTVVVRSAGFGWQLVDGLRHQRSAPLLEDLCDALDRAEALAAELPAGLRLPRGTVARIRNLRPLPPGSAVPPEWQIRWDAATSAISDLRQRWESATATDEADVALAVSAIAADPRVRDALVCSGPGVFRDLQRSSSPPARVRRQLASYAQRLATKCETMSFFGPVNYATVDPGLDVNALLVWKGLRPLADRRAFLSAWGFHRLLESVLAEPFGPDGGGDGGPSGEPGVPPLLVDRVVPRRRTFAGLPRAGSPLAVLLREVDGVRPLAELAAAAGLTPEQGRRALDEGVRQGRLGHHLLPPAVLADPTRWLAERLDALAGSPVGACPADARRRVAEVIRVLDAYPDAPAGAKLDLQEELRRLLDPGPGTTEQPARSPQPGADGRSSGSGAASGPGEKFYNDRVIVTEAAAGTLELTIGGDLRDDLHTAVPAALDLLADAAVRTRRQANTLLAQALGTGRFPLLQVLADHGRVPLRPDPRLPARLTDLVGAAGPDATELDLTGLLPLPEEPDLPVLGSADVMVVVRDLADYTAGRTRLVVGDVHDAPLLTPWALQFHADADAALAQRDHAIGAALGTHRAVGVVARRTTGLPPLRFPGPVVELGTVDGPAERLPLDRLVVHSDGARALLRVHGRDENLFLHNGELDTFVHTALALPRLRPLPVPDLAHVPRLRYGNVVLGRRRWRLHPGPLGESNGPPRDAAGRIALRRALRTAGVPARFFAKASHQRKPLYVDTDSPLLVEALFRLLAGADRLHAGEVLPGPDALWLRDGEVDVAAELRCVYLRRPRTQGPRSRTC